MHWDQNKIANHKKFILSSQPDDFSTGKSASEALILESVNPQYGERLFIELQEKYNSEHFVYKYCFECQNKTKQIFVHNMF